MEVNRLKVREFPCCMCPSLASNFKLERCANCDYAVTYEDKRGYTYFVRSGIGGVFKAFYTKPGTKKQKSCAVFKEWRNSFTEAQADLNRVAKERGWTPIQKEEASH